MVYKTFDEWSNLGYKIIKGSRAIWIDDRAMFSEEQVINEKELQELRLIAECTNPNG